MTKEQKKEYDHQRYLKNKEKILANNKQWREDNPEYDKERYQDNKEKKLMQTKQYYQEHKEEKLDYNKQYRKDNKEKIAQKDKRWRDNNKEYISEYHKEYNKTKMGRALYLLRGYNRSDKEHNRGECTLTAKWIVANIFTKPCVHCGETDWRKIGCNRINNDLPHTHDNVEPCCWKCNRELWYNRNN